MKLSLLSILLGCGMAVPQVYGLARPKEFGEAKYQSIQTNAVAWRISSLVRSSHAS